MGVKGSGRFHLLPARHVTLGVCLCVKVAGIALAMVGASRTTSAHVTQVLIPASPAKLACPRTGDIAVRHVPPVAKDTGRLFVRVTAHVQVPELLVARRHKYWTVFCLCSWLRATGPVYRF